MWLREAVPGSLVRSIPDPRPAGEPALTHVLHRGATIPGQPEDRTRELVAAAAAHFDLAGDGRGSSRVRFDFDEPPAPSRAA